jgi:hypothetical protein
MAEEQQAAEGMMNNILPPDNIFVYTGEQRVPRNVTHVIIDRSVKIIPERAFQNRRKLVSVEMHDGVEKIERWAFQGCHSLRGIKNLPGVVAVERAAFQNCRALTDVECGDRLETIGMEAFSNCHSLQKIKMPTVRIIRNGAFCACMQLTDVELPAVETIGQYAFYCCPLLRRIAIPLKNNMFTPDSYQRYNQFDDCENLTTVDLGGGVHNTIASLLLESWRNEMNQEINRINQVLPNTRARGKTDAIQEWIRSVISRMEHYKAEHYALLKEDMTQLELALWKAKLDEKNDDSIEERARIDTAGARNERRITSGASIVMRNVLPFLQLG